MKVKPEWIDGEVAGSGDLQKAYDKSVDGSILTDSTRGSIDFRNGETGADYPILTIGFTGQAPTTSISGVNAKVASTEGTLENVQAGAILGGYQTTIDEYSHGSVSLGGYDTHVTEVSENSLVGSSARVKVKRAILSSVLSSSADPDCLSGGQTGSSIFPSSGYSGYAEIRGGVDKKEKIGLGNTLNYQNFLLEGNTLIGGSFSNKGSVSINLDLGQLDPESSYFVSTPLSFTETRLGITQRFASRVFRRDASTLILVNDAGEILEYNTDTYACTTLVGGGSSTFTEGMDALDLDSSLVSVVYPRSNGDILIVVSYNRVVQYSSSTGTLSLFAGDGTLWKYFVTTPSDGGDLYKMDTGVLATSSNLNRCTAIVEDSSGNIYLADTYSYRTSLRMVDTSGTITTKYTWDFFDSLGGDIVSLLMGNTGNVFLGVNSPGRTLFAEYDVGTSTVTNRYTSTSDEGVLSILLDSSDGSFLLIRPQDSGGFKITKVDNTYSAVWSNYVVSPLFNIASKNSMLLGTTDSFMDTVEGSGISFARRSAIRSIGGTWDNTPVIVSEISSSTDVQVVGTSFSSVDSSEEIYMGPIAEVLGYPLTKSSKVSASSNITLKGSTYSTVSSSSYLQAGGMHTSFIAASSSSEGQSSSFCVGALKNTTVLSVSPGWSPITIGDTGPLAGMTGYPNSIDGSLIAANRGGLDLHYMTAASITSSSQVMVNSGLSSTSGLPLTLTNSSVSSSRVVTLVGGICTDVTASVASMLVQSQIVSVNASEHVQVSETLRSSVISTLGRVIDHSTNCLVAAEGANDGPNSSPSGFPFSLTFSSRKFSYNHRSASVANCDVNMAYSHDGFIAGSSEVGVGIPAPYISPDVGAGLTGFFGKIEAVFEGISTPQNIGYTGTNNTVVLGSKAVESIKTVGSTTIGSNKVALYASNSAAILGMVDYKHVFSDRTVSAGGASVVVGPYSSDSFFGGNSTTDFKQVQNSIGAGVSSSTIKRANYSAVLASTGMVMEGLDRSGSIWTVDSKSTDIISSGMLGVKTGEMVNDVRSGIFFSEGTSVLESSLSGTFFANGALISNGSGVALIGTESTSVEDGILSSSISTKDSSIVGGSLGVADHLKSAGVFQAASTNSRATANTFSVQQATWSSRLDKSQLSLQASASDSGITGSSLSTQISVHGSLLQDSSLASQVAVSQSVISKRSTKVLQAASYNATVESGSQVAQVASAAVGVSGDVYDSAQVAAHGTALQNSLGVAQVAVYGGETGYGVIEGQCVLQASSASSYTSVAKQVTQLSSYQSFAARSNTSAQIATRSSSMTGLAGCSGYSEGGVPQETGWTYQSVQMSSVESLMGGTIASTQMAATNSSMVATTNSAQIAVQDSSITGATSSVVMASSNSQILAVKDAAVIGGIGGIAKNQGEVVQGAGGSGGAHQKQTVLFSREVNYDVEPSAWYELFPQGSNQRFKIDVDETYYVEIRMAINQISNAYGRSYGGGILKFEGMIYSNGGSSTLYVNSLITPVWEKHHGAVSDATTFLYNSAPWIQSTNTNELEILVKGLSEYTISYTMELSLLKAS